MLKRIYLVSWGGHMKWFLKQRIDITFRLGPFEVFSIKETFLGLLTKEAFFWRDYATGRFDGPFYSLPQAAQAYEMHIRGLRAPATTPPIKPTVIAITDVIPVDFKNKRKIPTIPAPTNV